MAVSLGLSISATGFSCNTPAADGRVVEKSTGRPIEGAFVIESRHRSVGGPHYISRSCTTTAIVVTDADGRFDFAGKFGRLDFLSIEPDRVWSAYKPGFTELSGTSLKPRIIEMARRMESKFEDLPGWNWLACDIVIQPRDWLPALRARYAEEKALARTEEQHKRADGLLFDIDKIQLGNEAAFNRLDDRLRERMRQDVERRKTEEAPQSKEIPGSAPGESCAHVSTCAATSPHPR